MRMLPDVLLVGAAPTTQGEKVKTAIAVVLALLVAGCASGPYYTGYGSYVEPYAAVPYYGYYDYPAFYGYPAVIGGSFYYYDRDDRHRDGRRWRDGGWRDSDRGSRGRDDDRGRDRPGQPPPRERLDTRHGEAGNEAGM
jgi:hypothetical protein